MLSSTSVNKAALCNIATGVGKILGTMIFPSATASASSPSSTSTSQFPGTFNTVYASSDASQTTTSDKGFTTEALPEQLVKELSVNGPRQNENMRYKAIPSTRSSRAVGFASLFMQLGWEKLSGGTPEGALLSQGGHQRIVDTLCRMRGAVLKLGQMLSIQDEHTIPAHVTQLFEKVRDSAFAMPASQLERTLSKEFNTPKWKEMHFTSFNVSPMAAASIGQVHYGELKAHPNCDWQEGAPVAIKVQYPGVAQSIDSDVANLKMLMSLNVLPPGMFVDSILKELRNELNIECQYRIEAAKQKRYGDLVDATPELADTFHVPKVYFPLCTDQVLVSEYIKGVPIDRVAKRKDVPQALKNRLAEKMMLLTIKELFEWRFMQTDPNYANFLFDITTGRINLLDFGAARDYDPLFVKDYLEVVAAAAREDRETIVEKSITLGFLTGNEVREMIDAHVRSVLLLGRPFQNREAPFDFSAEHLPSQIQKNVPTMVKYRLRPPPTPIYSLHRRLSGTILLATQMGAKIDSGKIFWDIYDKEIANLTEIALKTEKP